MDSENLKNIEIKLSNLGFDVTRFFNIKKYNSQVEDHEKLKPFSDENEIAILIGNSAKLWPIFIEYIINNPSFIENKNPFDDFVEIQMSKFLKDFTNLNPIDTFIRYAHKPEPTHFPFQRLAELIGLARLSKFHLSIHPDLGPWFSLRAVIQFNLNVDENLNELISKNLKPLSPCVDYENECMSLFEKAVSNEDDWRAWLAIREACPIGKQYRFSDIQIQYHYTKNPEILKSLINSNS